MRILWINPVGTDVFDADMQKILIEAKRRDTEVRVVSLPAGRPTYLSYHAYEGLVIPDIIRMTHQAAGIYDAVVIGCFYDTGLREARELSGQAIVTAPCQSAVDIAGYLGNSFSILVAGPKEVPKMTETVRKYGRAHAMASMRPLHLGVHEFQADPSRTRERLMIEATRAVQEDGAEVIILGCTAEYGFNRAIQAELGVPVIDAVTAPFKYAEFMAEVAVRFGWYPSRLYGSQAPPADEAATWDIFQDTAPIIRG